MVAVGRRARSRLKEIYPEAIAHRRCKGSRVEIEVERMRRGGVAPVAGVRQSERMKAGLVTSNGRGGELRTGMSVDGGGEGVLRETRG